MSGPVLEVADLHVGFDGGETEAVRGVSFALGREKLGLVGESGSGKSSLARALLGLVPRGGSLTAQKLQFSGGDLLGLGESGMRRLRGRRMAMILQDPHFSLNPVMTVGRQVAETWRTHFRGTPAEARDRTLAMLESVGFHDPARVARAYPHQLSGGEGQRAMIAAMLIAEPELLIADEPTSALDVTVRNHVLAVIDGLVARRGMALLFISHDLALVASFCDRVMVMYAGRILESLAADKIAEAKHPYTRSLLGAIPRLDDTSAELHVVPRDPAWAGGP